jgi:hypothetical protein
MMSYERTEKELDEIFEEIQHSYKTFADDALALGAYPRVRPQVAREFGGARTRRLAGHVGGVGR